LLSSLEREIRKVSAQSVLFSQTVAERAGLTAPISNAWIHHSPGHGYCRRARRSDRLTTGAITGVIDRLEKAGFARRERDTEDRRRVLVRPLPDVERRMAPLYASLR
jgi:hypothetical protein